MIGMKKEHYKNITSVVIQFYFIFIPPNLNNGCLKALDILR